MSRWKILAVVVLLMATAGAEAQNKTLEVNFTGLQVFEAKNVSGHDAESVEVLIPDARGHGTHPHFAEIRFACDDNGGDCYRTYSLVDTEVRFVSAGAGQNPPVELLPTYALLIGFTNDLKYGDTNANPKVTARVFLQGGKLGGHPDKICKYAFAEAAGPPPNEADFKERSFLSVLRQEIDTTKKLHIELKDWTTGATTTIPIDPNKPWLFYGGVVKDYVTVWIVNDPPLGHVPPDLKHYLALRDWLGAGHSTFVPYRHASCPGGPSSGTSFCPPATQP